jgi:hypothetical protein
MSFEGPLLIVPRETRELAFEVIDFQWKELASDDEVLAVGQ